MIPRFVNREIALVDYPVAAKVFNEIQKQNSEKEERSGSGSAESARKGAQDASAGKPAVPKKEGQKRTSTIEVLEASKQHALSPKAKSSDKTNDSTLM